MKALQQRLHNSFGGFAISVKVFPEYQYAMNFGFNINPAVVGKGAAIFLHCNSTHKNWTAGCVSVREDIMLEIFLKARQGEYIIIVPRAEDIANY